MSSFIHRKQSCRGFEFQDICTATENFDESLVIGSGGFGMVYKGRLSIGSSHDFVAAFKRFNHKSTHDEKEFLAEVCTLSMLCHPNIVSLFGYCVHEKKDNILVSEYMSNGTLDDHLHKYNTRLSWIQRLKICLGVAHGLCYLHDDTNIIHGYISSSKVLLHQNWDAKLSNFGLGKTCSRYQSSTYVNTCVIGNFGYLDPIYFETGKLSKKSDVYSFGVLMLEVLCRKPVVGEVFYGEGRNLVKWAQISIKAGKSRDLIDSGIRREMSLKFLKKFVSIAEKCLHEDLKLRPTMAEVVADLKDVLALQEKFNHSWLGGFISFSSYSKKLSHLFPHIKLIEILTTNFDQTSIMSEDYKVVYPCNSFRSTLHNNIFLETKEVRADTKSLSPSVKEFMFDDLVQATQGFHLDVLVGEGGFEKVFLGWVDQDTLAPSKHGDGINVAVKRLDAKSNQAHDEWMAQVNIVGPLAHPNIIRLLGYCKCELELLLVYEYMPHLSFDHLLFKDDIAEPLSWRTRLLIMIRVARGLTYLHSRNIIVRDLKSSNILLDEAYNAKLGSFGFVKYGPETEETHVNASVKGTLGYIAPEYFHTGCLSVESDIYSFGLVLLGTMTGRKPVDNKQSDTEELNIRNVKEIMDPRLGGNYHLEGASRCFKLALRCVERNPKDRPSSEEVLQGLEEINKICFTSNGRKI
ncbi:hypothetical protein QVD17_02599 [Tagetes erecta]|uniref:Protein kinase domain-containing protein n=1 Tax=Tagetes erecta TaxID=13708 RepID=A0AAD8P2K8_TARER|nr:hypothetical protein QVD17_02599 [Tagetes erecta]